jgi:hypothetical protein
MSEFRSQFFFACRDCSVLQPIFSESRTWDANALQEALDAFNAFVMTHSPHRTAWLSRSNNGCHSDRPLWDPLAVLVFEVSDGQQPYVVTAARDAIDQPRTYRFIPASLALDTSPIALDDRELRRGLDLEFYPHAVRPTKLDRFLAALHEVISRIDPESLPIAFDAADDPAVSIACIPHGTYEELMARCTEIFDQAELSTVTKFLDENRREDGLLALRVRREHRTLFA